MSVWSSNVDKIRYSKLLGKQIYPQMILDIFCNLNR